MNTINILFTENGDTITVLGGVISALAAIGIGIIEYYNLTPNKKNFAYVAFIGALITMTGTCLSSKSNDKKTEVIISANNKIDSLINLNLILMNLKMIN